MSEKKGLTPEQIKNWRTILCGMIGPYAFMMPDEEVQRLRDKMQSSLDSLPDEPVKNADTDSATFMGMDKATELVREKTEAMPEKEGK